MRTIFAAVLFLGIAAAQTFIPIGSSTDGCAGGAVFPSPVMRYGNFTCIEPVTPGNYTVTLMFVEPTFTTAGGRAFSVSLNGYMALPKLDLIAAGATLGQPFNLNFPVVTVDGNIRIVVTTLTGGRNGLLSAVTIAPAVMPPPDLSGYALKTDLLQLVPYKGATSDVNLGSHSIFASVFDSIGGGPWRMSVIKAPCPAAADPGTDSTFCMDMDGVVYKVSAAGVKTPIGQ